MDQQEHTIIEQKTSLLRLLEVMTIKDTLAFMSQQTHTHDPIIPKCICTTGMQGFEYDEDALLRLQAKLLPKEEKEDE